MSETTTRDSRASTEDQAMVYILGTGTRRSRHYYYGNAVLVEPFFILFHAYGLILHAATATQHKIALDHVTQR